MRLTVYQWENGARVDLDFSRRNTPYLAWRPLLRVIWEHRELTLSIFPAEKTFLHSWPENRRQFLPMRQQLTGFCLDLGIETLHKPPDNADLLGGESTEPVAPWRQVVPDDVWENRYELIRSNQNDKRSFLLPRLDVWEQLTSRNQGWKLSYGYSGDFVVGKTKEEALDALTARLCMIPESEAPSWEKSFPKRGSFVDPQEMELYRCLGEPIPFLWPAPELRQWAIDRGATP